MQFYPLSAAVPDALQTDRFRLEPLTVDHNPLDYAAVMASKDHLRMWSGSAWPADDFTPDENRADLDGHQREHEAREAFTYTVLSAAGDVCLGCIYIKPATVDLLQPENFDAVVRFWVTPDVRRAGLDEALLAGLRAWLGTSFSFRRVFFHTNTADAAQQRLFERAGLARVGEAEISGRGGRYVFYR
jgi:RimJ/RimL family protein N-acetyltransferase